MTKTESVVTLISRCLSVKDVFNALSYNQLFVFGVLTSSVHMAWTRAVCGRLKSDYRYSATIVYNNFIWCKPTIEQALRIIDTAKNILEVRSSYSLSMAELYDETSMPDDLRAAHKENDRAVMAAYGFDESMTDTDIVRELLSLYKRKVEGNG